MAGSAGLFERHAEPGAAVERARSIAADLSLHLEIKVLGAVLATQVCYLTDITGQTYTGCGKGIGAQSEASAIFEAFEHYFYLTEDIERQIVFRPIDLEEGDVCFNGFSPDFSKAVIEPGTSIGRLIFHKLNDLSRLLQYPAFLTHPHYCSSLPEETRWLERANLDRYSSNSGTASGLSVPEALLHGLLEGIERDAISVELLRTVISKKPSPVRILNIRTLSPHLQEILRLAERESEAKVEIYDFINDIGIPVAAASVKRSDSLTWFGFGSSLSFEYAIERAVLEAIQAYHLQTSVQNKQIGKTRDSSFGLLPLYDDCRMNNGRFGYRGARTEVDYTPSIWNTTNSIEEQLKYITARLAAFGFSIYYRVINATPIAVVQVVVPELERFYLVTSGQIVSPSKRGKQFLSKEIYS